MTHDSAKRLTELAESLPILKTKGIRADHAAAAQAIIDRARAAMLRAAKAQSAGEKPSPPETSP